MLTREDRRLPWTEHLRRAPGVTPIFVLAEDDAAVFGRAPLEDRDRPRRERLLPGEALLVDVRRDVQRFGAWLPMLRNGKRIDRRRAKRGEVEELEPRAHPPLVHVRFVGELPKELRDFRLGELRGRDARSLLGL